MLKGIPADQMIPTMQFITASLGVECEFCHVQNAFDKDDKKPKQTARKMMEMMFAINKDNFEGHREVTCNSCHRGNANPMAIPAVMTEEPRKPWQRPAGPEAESEAEATRRKAGPAADQLLDKYVQAAGGAPAIEKVTSRVMKGTIEFGGKSLPIDIYCERSREAHLVHPHAGGRQRHGIQWSRGLAGTPGRPIARDAWQRSGWGVDRRRSASRHAFEADVQRTADRKEPKRLAITKRTSWWESVKAKPPIRAVFR